MFNKRKETCEIYKDKNLELFEAENREMVILHPFLPVSVPKNVVLQYLNRLSITKDKKNFKVFKMLVWKNLEKKLSLRLS